MNAAALTAALAQRLPAGTATIVEGRWRLEADADSVHVHARNALWADAYRCLADAALRELAAPRHVILVDDAQPGADRERGESLAEVLVDPGSQFARASLRAVLESPGLQHNPLYLHGPAGSGKTWMLRALAHEARQLYGESAVALRRAADLVDDGSAEADLDQGPLASAPFVLIDSLDDLSGRPLAQERCYLLINHALERGQQLVCAARHAPRLLGGLEERLVSRLAWGLVVAIDAPLAETRLGLLRRRLGERRIRVPAAELPGLVEHLAPDLHEAVALAERLAAGEDPRDERTSFDHILLVVSEHFGIRAADLAGKRRHRELVQARQAALLLGRRLTSHSLTALGGMVGGRDHTTVMHALRQAEQRAAGDPDFARILDELSRSVLARGR